MWNDHMHYEALTKMIFTTDKQSHHNDCNVITGTVDVSHNMTTTPRNPCKSVRIMITTICEQQAE